MAAGSCRRAGRAGFAPHASCRDADHQLADLSPGIVAVASTVPTSRPRDMTAMRSAELEQLVEVGRDQDRGDAGVGRCRGCAGAMRRCSARRGRRSACRRSRLWRRRPARAPEAPSGCCRRTAGRSASPRRACGRRSRCTSRRGMRGDRAAAGRSRGARTAARRSASAGNWSRRGRPDRAFAQPVVGHVAQAAAARRSPTSSRSIGLPSSRIAPGGSGPLAGQRLGELLLAVAVDAGDAEDLAGRDVEKLIAARASVSGRARRGPRTSSTGRRVRPCGACRHARAGALGARRSARDPNISRTISAVTAALVQRLQPLRRDLADLAAEPQDRDAVAEGEGLAAACG